MGRRIIASRLLTSVVLCLLAATSRSQGLEVDGHMLGERVDAVLSDPRYDCDGVSACLLYTVCTRKDGPLPSLAGVPLESLKLHFAGERLSAIEAQFAPARFDQLAEAMLREYELPQAATRVDSLRTQDMAPNTVYLWRDGPRVLRLEREFRDTGRSSLIIADRSFLSELLER